MSASELYAAQCAIADAWSDILAGRDVMRGHDPRALSRFGSRCRMGPAPDPARLVGHRDPTRSRLVR